MDAAALTLASTLKDVEDASGICPLQAGEGHEPLLERLAGDRLLAAAQRLRWLSYLDDDAAPVSSDDPAFRAAVRHFQKDAAIPVDGWVGASTWSALQELVGLQGDFDIKRWAPPGASRALEACRRATRLRLRLLDIAVDEPVPGLGLRGDFKAFEVMVDVVLGGVSMKTWRDALVLLFDHDALLRAFGDMRFLASHKHVLPSSGIKPKTDLDKLLRRVIVAATRHALYLRGISVGDLQQRWSQSEQHRAVAAYKQEVGAPDLPNAISPSVLRALAADEVHDDVSLDIEGLSAAVERQPTLLERARDYLKGRTSFLWDGLRAAHAWLKKKVGDLVGLALDSFDAIATRFGAPSARHLAKLLLHHGAELLTVVRHGVTGLVRAVKLLFGGDLSIGDGDAVRLRVELQPGGDAICLASPHMSAADAEELTAIMRASRLVLAAASEVIQIVVTSVKAAAGGVLTWWLMVAALMKRAGRLFALGQQLATLLPHLVA